MSHGLSSWCHFAWQRPAANRPGSLHRLWDMLGYLSSPGDWGSIIEVWLTALSRAQKSRIEVCSRFSVVRQVATWVASLLPSPRPESYDTDWIQVLMSCQLKISKACPGPNQFRNRYRPSACPPSTPHLVSASFKHPFYTTANRSSFCLLKSGNVRRPA